LQSAAVALLLTQAPVAAEQQNYTIDPASSRVTIHVDKSGLLSFAGHAHEISAPVAEGRASFDPANLTKAVLHIEFDARALRVDGAHEPAGDLADVQRTMESGRVLDVARFPRMTFTSTAVTLIDRSADHLRVNVTGDLTIRGTTRPERAEIAVDLTSDGFSATGALRFKQTEFGIQPVTAGAGTVRVKDEITMDFTFVGRAGGAGAER
jgi:polyisoprenoid-binding protein YceI